MTEYRAVYAAPVASKMIPSIAAQNVTLDRRILCRLPKVGATGSYLDLCRITYLCPPPMRSPTSRWLFSLVRE